MRTKFPAWSKSPALSALALIAVHVDVSAAVGRTPGTFDVTAGGEGTYTIPIAVPPGVNGLTPQLALTYASRSRQSIAGYGWNISGAMAIARCNSTIAQDGVARQVRNDVQDRFCLNGSKLRLVSAAGTYGLAGSEYRTEIETFSRITYGPQGGSGPNWFKVEGRDGLIYEFGATPDSLIESKGQTTARSWALSRVRDRDFNEIKYTYTEDLLGAYRLASITYGGNSGLGATPSIYTVSFTYEARPTAEIESSYKADANVKETNRLDRIDVKYGSTLYRSYDLTYEPALSAAKHSRLAAVRECAGSTPDCFTATTFTYKDSPALSAEVNTGSVVPGTNPLPIDVNGDGREDLVYPSATNVWMVMFANSTGGYDSPMNTGVASTGAAGAIPFDYDGNGQQDLLVPYSGGTWWVLYGSSSGLSAPQNTGTAATGTGTNARALDIDGDGQDDLVWADLNPTPYAGGDVIRSRRKIPGAGFATTVTDLIAPLPVDQAIPNGVFSGWAQKMPRRVPDFNGDGRDDLAFRKNIRRDISTLAPSETGSTEAALTATYRYSFKLIVVCPGVTSCLDSAAGVASVPYFGDLNGDGQSDILYYDDDGAWKYRYATGTTFTNPMSMGSLSSYGDALILDWDVDGYDDLLMLNIAANEWHVIRSTGEGFASPVATGISGVGMTSPVVADMNGDNIRELAYRGSSNTWRYKARPVTLDYQDELVSATDAFGVTVTFSYAPTTISTVYTRGLGALFPAQELHQPLWVVSNVSATDATGNGSSYTLTFTYETGRVHASGRGFLGFAKRTIVDSRVGYNIKTIETYNQAYPYVGTLKTVEQQQSSGTRMSLLTNTWSTLSWGAVVSTERSFPYLSKRVLDEHELNGTKFRTTTTTVAATGGIDTTSGLILDWTTDTTDGVVSSTTRKSEHVQHTSKLNDLANWCIGRPIDTTVTNSHTLADGAQIIRNFDAAWDGGKCRPTQRRIDPDNSLWSVTIDLGYDDFGNINSQTVKGGGSPAMTSRTTLTDWGTDGHFPRSVEDPLSVQDPLKQWTTTLEWNDAVGRLKKLTDPNGIATSFTYDSFGRLDTTTRPDLTKQKLTYGNVCSTCGSKYRYHVQVDDLTAANALIRRQYVYLTQWDQVFLERVLLVDSSYSITASRDFDARGRLTKQLVPYIDGTSNLGSRRWTYDRLDRVLTDSLYDSAGTLERQTTYGYSGLASTVTDPLTHATTQTLAPWGDLLSVQDAMNGIVYHQYNAFSELKQTKDTAGNIVATISYVDERGLRTGLDDMNLGNTVYVPNALGEVVSQKDANQQLANTATTFEYDLLGRMTKRIEPDATSEWTWATAKTTNDRIGRLKKVTGPGYEENLEYNDPTAGRLTSRKIVLEGVTHQFDFVYNSIGELDTLTYPTSVGSNRFQLKYEYGNGYLNSIRDFTGGLNGTQFWGLNLMNARGQPTGEVYRDATLPMQTTFKALTGEIDTRTFGTVAAPTSVQNLAYTWDLAGNFKTRTDLRQAGIHETANYDALNRLTQVTDGPAGTLNVFYDAIGNVTSRSDINNNSTWVYDTTKKNAVRTAGTINYNYDANGNMTSRNGVTQTWNSANLPATLATSSFSTQFSYAPDRSRWKQVATYSSGTETTLFIGGLLEKHTSGSSPTNWKHLIATPSGEVQYVRRSDTTTETYYIPSDHLGGADAVLNSAGAVLVRTSFDAWGARRDDDWAGAPSSTELQQIANTTRHGFTGHGMLDNVGLIHMNGRVYDPAIGRFMSADPFVPTVGTQGLNRYAYTLNSPLSYTDPSGFVPAFMPNWDDPVHTPGHDPGGRPGPSCCGRGPTGGRNGNVDGQNGGVGARGHVGPSQTESSIDVSTASTVGRIDTVGLLLSRGPIIAPYEPLFRDNFAGHVLQSLDYSAGILAAPFRDGEVRGLFSNQYPSGRELMDAKMGLVLAAAPVSRLSGGVSGGTSSLFRAVGPAELADIQSTGVLRSIAGLEGKYFTTSAEAASSYARQAVRAFGDPPYTLIRVDVSNRIFRGLTPATVDSGIPAWVIPNSRLPGLSPQVLDIMLVPSL
jgi:RHS repeat-associated protein